MAVDWVRAAESLVHEVLDERAAEVDRTGKIPPAHFEALAARGFFGFPLSPGMSPGLLIDTAATVISGCLATGFVWAQHLGALRSVAAAANPALREEYLPRLLNGSYRCGVSYAGARSNPTLFATPAPGGYLLTGTAPFVTGWDYIDAVVTAVRITAADADSVATLLVPVHRTENLAARRLPLIAADAGATVRLDYAGAFVPEDRLLFTKPVDPHEGGNELSDWINGALALGVLTRCTRQLTELGVESSSYTGQLEALRGRYHAALGDPGTTHDLRAEIARAAVLTAAAGVVAAGSRATLTGATAERLMREATFALVCTNRDPITAALLRRLEPGGTTA